MKKINSISLNVLRNKEHFQFMSDLDALLLLYVISELGIEADYPNFKQLLTDEDAAMRLEQGSALTKKLIEFDRRRDHTWFAVNTSVKAYLYSPFEAEEESAEAVMRVLKLYGDMRSFSFNEKSAAMTNLCTDLLKEEMSAHLTRINLTAWVVEMQKENNDFINLFNSRNSELAGRDKVSAKSVRLLIDPIYQKIVEKINATVTMEVAKPATFKMIDELNEKIKYYQTAVASRTRKGKSNDTTDEKES